GFLRLHDGARIHAALLRGRARRALARDAPAASRRHRAARSSLTARRSALVACAAVCAVAVAAGVARASDGGSATYTVTGARYDFVLFNSGTSRWQYFFLVGPAGTTFVGGGT